MRIRKRQVPLPLSSLSPIPISDPNFNGSTVVQLHHDHDPHQNLSQQADARCSQLSDLPNQSIGSGSCSLHQKDKDCLVLLEEGDYNNDDDDDEEEEEESNDSRKNSILGPEIAAAAGVLSQLSSSHQVVVGSWCEGEKAFPLKKRRRENEEEEEEEEEEEIMIMGKDTKKMINNTKMMKNKMSKKFDDNEQEEEEQSEQTKGSFEKNSSSTTSSSSSKKRARGNGAIMEGSRCSRVNGRGWRCCQQTLVGYSLCEHHLGKGRLRCMNSVRSRSSSLGTTDAKLALISSSSSSTLLEGSKMKQQELIVVPNNNEVDEDEKKPLMIAKRRMNKLGVVKARSMSSLLGQKDNNEIIAAD